MDSFCEAPEVVVVELNETSSTLTASDDVEEAGEDTSQLSDVEVTGYCTVPVLSDVDPGRDN